MSSRAAVSVLFSDVVDSTATAARLGPESAESLRRTYFGLLRSGVTAAGGTEVKSIGDGLMVVFPSVSAALACGVTTQQEIDRYNQVAAEPLRVRIGISFGEVDLIEDDYFGTSVVEAARLCALAVLSREVGSGDGWLASEGGVAAVMVVEVQPTVKCSGSGGV
jgi:class 3 adenylate cyclase